MNRLAAFMLLASLLAPALLPAPVRAGGCFEDPIYERSWTGVVTTGAFVRDVACMEGSTVMTTLTVGTTVAVIGETDGWYKVELSNGSHGWVGQWLLSITDKTTTPTTPEKKTETTSIQEKTIDSTLLERVKGHILLQVESHGEAWYVNPEDGARYYMKDGATAYEMMRAFGLGISEKDFAGLESWDYSLRSRLAGQIVLRVEEHGEAYWIHPDDLSVHYLKDGAAAYELMRAKSLGITNTDLKQISSKEFVAVPYKESPM